MIRIIAAAAIALVVQQGTARAAAYLDEAAWHGAVHDLDAALGPGVQLHYAPIAVHVTAYEDGYGVMEQDRGLGFHTDTAPGSFSGSLGCVSYAYPCLGAWRVTLAFDTPVYGIGGKLAYQVAYGSHDEGQVLPFFEGTLGFLGPDFGYDGFFGILQPMTGFALTFYEGLSQDDSVSFTFTGSMLVAAVSEPGSLPLLVAGFALLSLVLPGRAAARRGVVGALSPSAGSR